MIISFFSHNEPGVRGTINTNDEAAPVATGVGEELLDAWLAQHEDVPLAKSIRSLEAFYGSWGNQSAFSAAEPDGTTPGQLSVIIGETLSLLQMDDDVMNIREDGEWREVADGDSLSGRRMKVTEDIIEAWDSGKITDEFDADDYQQD